MTTRVGIREMTRQTSKWIHRAAGGETLIITEHDRPIAMLSPIELTGDPHIDQMIRDGLITPAKPGGIEAILAIKPDPANDGIDLAEVISEMREDRL
jgi:antitoxin (DNA-binding transcriptional repressor) of toxin-antitoxin stability system